MWYDMYDAAAIRCDKWYDMISIIRYVRIHFQCVWRCIMRVHLFTLCDIVGGTWTTGLDSIATLPALVHSVAAEQGQDGSGLSPSKIDLKLIYWHILAMKWKWIYISTCQFNLGCFQKRICVSILRRHRLSRATATEKTRAVRVKKCCGWDILLGISEFWSTGTAEAFWHQKNMEFAAGNPWKPNPWAFPGAYEHRLHHSPRWAAGDIFEWTSCVYRL